MDLQVTLFLLIFLPLSFFATLGFCCVEIRSCWRHCRLSIQTQRHVLNRHISLVHEGKKPFKCEVCDYSCSQRSTMNVHVASVHERKKPFKCNICDYSCSQKGNMERHVSMVHEKKKPFKCDICDYNCSEKGSLNRHVACA